MEVRGKKVTIRPTTRQDLPDLLRMWNDGRVMKWIGFPNGLGYDQYRVAEWFEHLQLEPHRHHFVVYAEGVGFCGELYYAVDQTLGRAALDVKFIPDAQGKGLATDAFQTLIDYVFAHEPDVDLVWTEPWQVNDSSRKLYTRCGLAPQPRPADLEPFEWYWALSRAQHRARRDAAIRSKNSSTTSSS